MVTAEQAINRQNTKAFIAANPTVIVLQTRTAFRTPLGGVSTSAGLPRPAQTFRLIMQSPAGGSIEQRTEDGTERQVDFTLFGEWDAQIAIGDWWSDSNDTIFEVRAIIPSNGYETRAVIEAHGRTMNNG